MPYRTWTSKHKQTFGIKREDDKRDHRTPPKPKAYYTQTKGMCRWCGKIIINPKTEEINMRKSWHSKCVEEYLFVYHQGEARKHIWERDAGYCAGCGCKCKKRRWHLDHINPLYEQKDVKDEDIDYSYWMPDNLQILCIDCHKEKTSKEATNRAEYRKGVRKKISQKSKRKYLR